MRVGCALLATAPLQVFPAAGGRTVERMLYASPHLQTVAGYPRETPRWLCHRRTWTTHLAEAEKKQVQRNAPLDFQTYTSTFCRLSAVGCFTFFPLDPSHIVTRWAGAALVCEHSLQVVVAAVVGTQVCRRHNHSFKLGWWLTRNTKLWRKHACCKCGYRLRLCWGTKICFELFF